MHDKVAKQLQEEEVWALKADRRLRLFVARQNGVRRIAGFADRSNHRFYGREV